MKSFAIVGFLVAAFLQVGGRSTGRTNEMAPILFETMQQTFECTSNMEPTKVFQLPQYGGMRQLPENNSALNELWGCIWEKKGIINKEAVLNKNKLIQYLADLASMFETVHSRERRYLQSIVQQCKNVYGYGYGQTAVKIQNCISNYVQPRP